MAVIRSLNDIIQDALDFYRVAQPDADMIPGTVVRDLFVEAPATQLSLLYGELSGISSQNSLRLTIGTDLDKYGKNFGVVRNSPTYATGVAILTFSSIPATLAVNRGDFVYSNSGIGFTVVNSIVVSSSNINFYKSVAQKYKSDLSFVGIQDQYAVEITVRATTAGSSGNASKYSITRTNIAGVTNVTNSSSFTGGTNQESDSQFRNRILSKFSGGSVGTALGYQNTALSISGVSDSYVASPGDTLMTRDGTVTQTNPDGSVTIVSEGTGGKTDVIVLGSNLVEYSDSYIYKDKSNSGNPTNSKNNFVLGQIAGDANKTINRKRIDDIASGNLPAQPVVAITSVSGSLSGSNFKSKTIDSFGRVFGNYELLKDTGSYAGSPWGFDSFKWISNYISMFQEYRIKSQYNGQDQVTYTDLLEIPQVKQNIPITNENSIVTSDRSIIQLLHYPVTNVTRVFNVDTGERYTVTNQNIDGTGTPNLTGRIKISGNTLPSPSNVLQVDYTWIVDYDQYSDYDGLKNTSNLRSVKDSIDWGYASSVNEESINFTIDGYGSFYTGTSNHTISTVYSALMSTIIEGTISQVTTGIFTGRLSVVLANLPLPITSVKHVYFRNTFYELYSTSQNNGTIASNLYYIDGYTSTIILPTDVSNPSTSSLANVGDYVTVVYNSNDVFTVNNNSGSVSGNTITIPASNVSGTHSTINLQVNYASNAQDLLSTGTVSLPLSRSRNGYVPGSTGYVNYYSNNVYVRENQLVKQNLSLQYYVELNLSSNDVSLNTSGILSVIRLRDNAILWNSLNIGSVAINSTTKNYQLILSGYNTPVISDAVLIIYQAVDIRRFQPFSFYNETFINRIDTLGYNPNTKLLNVKLNKLVSGSSVSFQIINPNTLLTVASGSDGVLIADVNAATATFTSSSINFGTIAGIQNMKVIILGTTYDIISKSGSIITISNYINKIDINQISVVKIASNKELINSSCTLDVLTNTLYIPYDGTAELNDNVYITVYRSRVLRHVPTRLISTITDQVSNVGTITVNGTSMALAKDIVFTVIDDISPSSIKINMLEALKTSLGLSSITSLPSNIGLAKVVKLEKVSTVSVSSNEVLQVLATYDLKNTKIANNTFYSDYCLRDTNLTNTQFIIPNTLNNTGASVPAKGDRLRISFYYYTTNDSENLSYTRNGSLYTNKKFALLDKVIKSSGFKQSQSSRLSLSSFTQPSTGSRYSAYYDYVAPKQNERIVIKYNYNKVLTDVTFAIESTRPTNADVLAKSSVNIGLDLTMNVVITSDMTSSTDTVLQNLRDALLSAMTTTILGGVIDASDLINTAYTVNGIDRATIYYFNKTGQTGQVLSVIAQNNESFYPNVITLNVENR